MIKKILATFGSACLFALCYSLLIYSGARAESLTYTRTLPAQLVDWTRVITFPQFDPNVGILTGVEITATGQVSGTLNYTNTNEVNETFSLQVDSILDASLPNNRLLEAQGLIDSFTETLSGGASSSRTLAGSENQGTAYNAPSDLPPFIGAGQITIPVTATGFFAGRGVANIDITIRTTANAQVVLRYLYVVPQIVIQKLTNGFDANSPNGVDVPQIVPGAAVVWTYIVTNTGSIAVPLAQVNVTDSQSGVIPVRVVSSDVNNDNLLSPGEAWRYTASGVAQNLATPVLPVTIVAGCNPSQGQAPGNRPTYENIGTVVVPGTTASDPSHYCNPPRPGIAILKRTNGSDANNPNGNDVPQIAPGAAVVWSYEVTNTGDITFTVAQVVVSDSQTSVAPVRDVSSDLHSDGLLSPGEVWRYTASGSAANLQSPPSGISVVIGCNPTASSAPGSRNTYRNIGTVTVPGATASDPSHYCNPPAPGIVIRKLTNGFDANNPNGSDVPQIAPGAAVVWSYLVTNTGNITFTVAQVTVSDSQTGIVPVRDASSDNQSDGLLAPGEVWRYTASGTAGNLATPSAGVTVVAGCNPSGGSAPGARNTYRNIGTVTVPGATASDPSHYCNPAVPGIVIKKYTNGADADVANGNDVPHILPGELVTWTYVITNTGNITFSVAQVVVSDDQNGVTPTRVASSDNGDNLLSPGEDWLYQAVGTGLDLKTQPVGVSLEIGCGLADPPFNNAYTNIGTVAVPGATASDPSHYCNPLPTGVDLHEHEPGRLLFLPGVRG